MNPPGPCWRGGGGCTLSVQSLPSHHLMVPDPSLNQPACVSATSSPRPRRLRSYTLAFLRRAYGRGFRFAPTALSPRTSAYVCPKGHRVRHACERDAGNARSQQHRFDAGLYPSRLPASGQDLRRRPSTGQEATLKLQRPRGLNAACLQLLRPATPTAAANGEPSRKATRSPAASGVAAGAWPDHWPAGIARPAG